MDQTLSLVIKLLLCQCSGKQVKGNNPYCAKLEMIQDYAPCCDRIQCHFLISPELEIVADRVWGPKLCQSCRSKRRNCSVQATRWPFIHHFLFLVVCSMQRRVASVQSRISFVTVLSLLYDRNSLILEKMILCSKLFEDVVHLHGFHRRFSDGNRRLTICR